jgi:hypothetical protein
MAIHCRAAKNSLRGTGFLRELRPNPNRKYMDAQQPAFLVKKSASRAEKPIFQLIRDLSSMRTRILPPESPDCPET